MPYYDDADLQGAERRQEDQHELTLGLLASDSQPRDSKSLLERPRGDIIPSPLGPSVPTV